MYFDNILIFLKNEENYIIYIHKILKRIINVKFQIDINKYKFYTKRTKYLGLIITPGGIKINLEKITAVIS